MTNKTITLSRELLERIVKGGNIIDSAEAMWELRATLADPVPPAGETVEVKRHYGDAPDGGGMCYYVLASDFDLHVTRLQAEISHLRQHKNDYMEAAEETRKALQAEVEEWKRRCQYNADTAHDLQSELTKARELLADVAKTPWMYDVLGSVREYVSSQSAPADKGQGESVADYPSAEIAEEAASGIYDIDFPSPEDEPAEQPAPVAVVTPEHRDSSLNNPEYSFARGWNACIDEVTRLNGIRP